MRFSSCIAALMSTRPPSCLPAGGRRDGESGRKAIKRDFVVNTQSTVACPAIFSRQLHLSALSSLTSLVLEEQCHVAERAAQQKTASRMSDYDKNRTDSTVSALKWLFQPIEQLEMSELISSAVVHTSLTEFPIFSCQ